MKYLFLILISLNSWAGFVAESKINICERTDYSSQSLCQESEKEVCFKVPNDSGECGIFKLKEIYGKAKFDEESCNGKKDCEELLPVKVCGVGRAAFIDKDYSEVYCVEIIGKEMVENEALKAQKKQERKNLEDQEKQKKLARKELKEELKNLDTSSISTVAQLRQALKKLIDLIEE